MSEVNAINLCS